MNNFITDDNIATQHPPGSGIELSSVGKFKIGGKIEDFILDSGIDGDQVSKWLSFVTYTLLTPKNQLFSGLFNYKEDEASTEEAKHITKGFEFCLKNVDPNMKLGDAIDYVRKNNH